MAIGLINNQHALPPRQSSKSGNNKKLLADMKTSNSSPVEFLPSEVLTKIFLCTPHDYVYDRWEIHPSYGASLPRISLHPGSSLDPMIIAQVCKRWHCVALETPLLWASIHILCSDKKERVPLLKAWLERSGTCPLSISFAESTSGFKACESEGLPRSPFTEEIMSLLVAQAYRWKAIDFTFARQIPPVLSNISVNSLSIIETASISSRQSTNDCFGGVAPLEKIWQAINRSPSFRSGRWEMEYLESNLHNIPWTQLTSINVTMSLDSLLKVLPLCCNLEELRYIDPLAAYSPATLPSGFRSPGHHYSDAPIIVPGLRHLSLQMDQSPVALLDRLTLPALQSYDIRLYDHSAKRSHALSLKDLFSRSGCRLKELVYDDPEANAETSIMEILSFPQLSSLMKLVVRPCTTDEFLRFLEQSGGKKDVLPALERLHLGPCCTTSGVLSEMVLSRRSKASCIAALRVLEVGRWDNHALDLKRLQTLSDKEIIIQI